MMYDNRNALACVKKFKFPGSRFKVFCLEIKLILMSKKLGCGNNKFIKSFSVYKIVKQQISITLNLEPGTLNFNL